MNKSESVNKFKEIAKYVFDRFNERSSAVWLVGLGALVGFDLSPETVLAVAGAVGILLSDGKVKS